MNKFVQQHPWMTFFLVSSAIAATVTIIRGRQPIVVSSEREKETFKNFGL